MRSPKLMLEVFGAFAQGRLHGGYRGLASVGGWTEQDTHDEKNGGFFLF